MDKPGTIAEATAPAWEFFDLEKAPKEIYNAYADPTYQSVITSMKKGLIELRTELDDIDQGDPIMQTILNKHLQLD